MGKADFKHLMAMAVAGMFAAAPLAGCTGQSETAEAPAPAEAGAAGKTTDGAKGADANGCNGPGGCGAVSRETVR